MSTARRIEVPTVHTQLELATFPLAAEAAFRLGATRLVASMDRSTKALWREAETQLIAESPALSLDELGSMRDIVWFADADEASVPLHRFLRGMAKTYLRLDGVHAVPQVHYSCDSDLANASDRNSEVEARAAWRWLSFALPPDLLQAALADPLPAVAVDAVSPHLAAILGQSGFAEPHLHMGAAMSFGVLWSGAVKAVADSRLREDSFKSPGAALSEGTEVGPWLLRAAIARLLLGAFLATERRGTFVDFIQHARHAAALRLDGVTVRATLDIALQDLCAGKIQPSGPSFADLQTLYAAMSSVRTLKLKDPWQVHHLDPLSTFAPPNHAWPSPEIWLVARGLAYLEQRERETSKGDVPFERLFWQTIRVRCLIYRHVVQRPMTPGLQWFVRVFRRLKPMRAALPPSIRVHAGLEISGAQRGLRAIEFRIGPESTVGGVLRELHALDRRADAAEPEHAGSTGPPTQPSPAVVRRNEEQNFINASPPSQTSAARPRDIEKGFVIHFGRDRGGGFNAGALKGHWQGTAADPGYRADRSEEGNPSGYRFARFYAEKRREALVLARLLSAFPVTLELIRGVDVCADEVGIPTWVLTPLLRFVCESSEAASAALLQDRAYHVPPIRRAVHAGEDFVHLLSGMRRLHDSIRYFRLRSGDRIGHGLALGTDPERWATESGRIAMTREDRLLDLVWAWGWSGRPDVPIAGQYGQFIESQIREHAFAIFEDRIEPAELARLVADLHSEQRLGSVGFPSGSASRGDGRRRLQNGQQPLGDTWRRSTEGHVVSPRGDSRRDADILLLDYLTDRRIFERSKASIWVNPVGEGPLMLSIQNAMRSEVAAAGIIVEVNPTSNLLIGHVPDLRNHPLWRLRPGPHRNATQPPLTLCIGSDDPLTFATTLPEEYQLLHDALVGDGASTAQADRWIDEVRRVGLECRFTVPRSDLKLTTPIAAVRTPVLPP